MAAEDTNQPRPGFSLVSALCRRLSARGRPRSCLCFRLTLQVRSNLSGLGLPAGEMGMTAAALSPLRTVLSAAPGQGRGSVNELRALASVSAASGQVWPPHNLILRRQLQPEPQSSPRRERRLFLEFFLFFPLSNLGNEIKP